MAPTLFLHIGAPKAGSSTLQRSMRANPAALAARGWFYPQAAGDPAVDLVFYARAADDEDRMARRHGLGDPGVIGARLEALPAVLAAEIEAAAPTAVFLSHENLFDRLGRREQLERLRDLLAPLFDRIEILAYLRRQDEAAVSRHAMALRNGAAGAFSPTPDFAAMRAPWFDYLPVLELWREVFGAEAIKVRRFGPSYFTGGGLVEDFAAATGLSLDGFIPMEAQNRAGDVRQLEFLHLLDARLGEAVEEPFWRSLRKRLMKPGPGLRPGASAERRAAFCAQFEASNRAVADRFLGLDGPLFDHPFADDEPTAADRLGAAEAVEIAVRLIERARKQG